MLPPSMIAEIRRHLAEAKLSQRAIARLLGVSRGTVGAIATGRRPDHPLRRPLDAFLEPQGPPRRCPGCGGMVFMPCLLCRAAAADSRRAITRRARDPRRLPPVGLELREEHHERYLGVRARKLRALRRYGEFGLPETQSRSAQDDGARKTPALSVKVSRCMPVAPAAGPYAAPAAATE